MPKNVRTDQHIVGGLNVENSENCRPEVDIKAAIATYSITCTNIDVQGTYVKGEALTATDNKIVVNLNVASPGSYYISTPKINGIEFSASGVFVTSGNQVVELIGSGTPTVNTDFNIDITTNTSEGHNTCSIVVPMTLPAMSFAIIGDDNSSYSWDNDTRKGATATASNGVFSPTGSVRVKSFTQLWNTKSSSDAAEFLTNGNGEGKYPDIVLFNAFGMTTTTQLADAVASYINRGGCVIFGSSDATAPPVETILRGIFGNPVSGDYTSRQFGGAAHDDVYKIKSLANGIVNGPFGNLSDRYWGGR